jgi:DNA-binding MarR family transcriptional regulator
MSPASTSATVWSPAQSSQRRRPQTRPRRAQSRRWGKHDAAILHHVHRQRILSQPQIERLIGRKPSTTQHILRRLYDSHYLNRVVLPSAGPGSSRVLYTLDRQGRAYLRQAGVHKVGSIPAASSLLFLQHTLALNDFQILLGQACQQAGWRLSSWRSENEIKQGYDRISLPGKAQPVALVPDGYFTIEVPDRGRSCFFLELDRGTMSQRRFQEKVAAYVAYYRSGGYRQRYGANGFRVLTVVAGVGQQRVSNLAASSSRITGIGRRFWFARLAALTPANVLHEPVWQIAGQAQAQRLLAVT